jgi:hypothetical protein
MPKVVICCRTSDSLGISGRILDGLVERFGPDAVALMDVDEADSPERSQEVESHVRDASMVLASVGQHWLDGIQNDNDPVRSVVRAVLASDIPIVPVLVNGARMPGPQQVPADIKDFVFRNATKIDPGPDFDRQIERLIRAVEVMTEKARSEKNKSSESPQRAVSRPQPAVQSPDPVSPLDRGSATATAPIFVSHSSRDRKMAETICRALEARGLRCWISSRDVAGGDNYQAAIVRAIRQARIMLLVFTENANNSDEIKKEIALASRNKLTVIPLRIEDVLPNEALDFEFATRQWIDFFADWEQALDTLCTRVSGILQS